MKGCELRSLVREKNEKKIANEEGFLIEVLFTIRLMKCSALPKSLCAMFT